MRRFAQEEMDEILAKHLAWLEDEEGGERADLRGVDLSGVNLSGACLSDADLSNADLSGADLSGAYLRGAYLRGADLSGADLSGAYLRSAYLRGAYLSGVNLRSAYLRGAYLSGVNLSSAYLRDAYLRDCQMNWQSHDLIAERLRQAAGEDAYKSLAAGYILANHQWCWDELMRDLLPWELSEMRQWVRDGDGAPGFLREQGDG